MADDHYKQDVWRHESGYTLIWKQIKCKSDELQEMLVTSMIIVKLATAIKLITLDAIR